MGIDRRSWACQSKRASSSSDNEGTLVDASPSSPAAARNPATPQDDRGYCRERSLGRKEFPGGIGAVGSDRRPWVNQASYLEVTRSPSYLKGTSGLTLSPSRAAAAAVAAAATGTTTQHPKSVVACSPSSTTVMESPPAPVRTGRPSKPRRAAAAAAAAAAGGGARVPPLGCSSGGSGGGGAPGQHLLPPPTIRREVGSGRFKSDARNSGGGRGGAGSSDAVAVAKSPSPLRYLSPARGQQKDEIFTFGRSSGSGGNEGGKREMFYFGKSGGGGDVGDTTPGIPGPAQPAPSTPRVGHRSRSTGADVEAAGHLPLDTKGAAFPTTPKVARGPDTPGYASTPCICSPPAPLHRGITGSGKPRTSSRQSIGVDCSGPSGSGRPPPVVGAAAAAAAAGDDSGQGLAQGWAEGEEDFGRSGTTVAAAAGAARRPARARRKCRLNQRKPKLADDDSGSCRESVTEADADGEGAETSGLRGVSQSSGGGSSSAADSCRRERSTNRKEQLLDASSSERFSEDFGDTRDGEGGGAEKRSGEWAGAGVEACPEERGVSRRRRRKRKPAVRRDEETLIDFKGRMAAIASATRLATAAATAATTSTRNAFVMATPPHPISSSAPPLPRRRLLSGASPSLSPPPPAAAAAAAAPEGRCPLSGGGSSTTHEPDGSATLAVGTSSADAGNVVACGSSEAVSGASSSGSAWSTPERVGKRAEGAGTAAAVAATAGLDGGGVTASPKTGGAGRSAAARPLTTVKPSERTAPKTRPWPDFERIRYEPPESAITTPLRRSDWTVPHGSAMHALAAALDEAAGSTACSSPLDMRQEGRESVRRRYQERADHFRLIQ
ncbi:unnamed protein product, partial [Ectocarpus fasciculatus]